MSNLCHCHIHVLPVGDGGRPACPTKTEHQRATGEKAHGQLVLHTQESCPDEDVMPPRCPWLWLLSIHREPHQALEPETDVSPFLVGDG